MFIPVHQRHENALSPFQPITGKKRPFQARTETLPNKRGVYLRNPAPQNTRTPLSTSFRQREGGHKAHTVKNDENEGDALLFRALSRPGSLSRGRCQQSLQRHPSRLLRAPDQGPVPVHPLNNPLDRFTVLERHLYRVSGPWAWHWLSSHSLMLKNRSLPGLNVAAAPSAAP